MDKPTARDKLIVEGLKLVHRNGFAQTSVRDIVDAAGVSPGSFTQQFESKEQFGLEVVALYSEYSKKLVGATLENAQLAPLERLRAYIDGHIAMMKRDGNRSGCLYGNFAAEASSCGDEIRKLVAGELAQREESVAVCLQAAVDARELPKDFDVETTAAFVIASLQGALLIAKVRRSPGALDALVDVLFDRVLAK